MKIKFRAWDKKASEMIEQFNIGVGVSNTDGKLFGVMQYTGYADSESTEIYFDDFMSNSFGTDKEVIRQVVMHEGTIMLKRVKGKSNLPDFLSLHGWHKMNMKVIGNIHKNPELK